jgi:hypothetical protein
VSDDLAVTHALAGLTGVPFPPELDRALVDLSPSLVEWSINAGDQRRGVLRLSAWTDDPRRAADILARLQQPAAERWHDAVPHEGPVGLGWQLAPGAPPRLRWWQLAPSGDGRALLQAALGHAPELRRAGEGLATVTGTPSRCAAIGIEVHEGRTERATLYFELLSAPVAVDLLGRIRVPATAASRTFFRTLCGLEAGSGRPWPKVWVARSVGRAAGWKFYVFLRGDPDRAGDRTVLEQLEASELGADLIEQARELTAAQNVIQLVGLTLFDEDQGMSPAWTLYLGRQ